MKRKWLLPAVILFFAFQLLITGSIVYRESEVAARGREYRFLCTFYDPVNPFTGRYLNLNPGNPCVPVLGEIPEKQNNVFVVLKDSFGFANPAYITAHRPEGNDAYLELKGKSTLMRSFIAPRNCETVNYPFTRFYLAEENAPRAEKLVNEALRDSTSQVWVSVYILDGRFQMNDVFINGKNLKALMSD